ncbi:MAG: hypothetical protein HC807_03650, partial [Gammaproteobacteria bacterium]|nr:hypothetical protein [Gammaproteobacteria bacterium]
KAHVVAVHRIGDDQLVLAARLDPIGQIIGIAVGDVSQIALGGGKIDGVHRTATRIPAARRGAHDLGMQADCLAGVWGHFAARRGLVDTRDIEAGLRAAAAIGDDRLQRRSQGHVVPEAFTHGSSEQRTRWFRRGLDGGDVGSCDTFSAAQL